MRKEGWEGGEEEIQRLTHKLLKIGFVVLDNSPVHTQMRKEGWEGREEKIQRLTHTQDLQENELLDALLYAHRCARKAGKAGRRMRKEDWEDREEEVQRLTRNFEDRLAAQRLVLLEAHQTEMKAATQVSSRLTKLVCDGCRSAARAAGGTPNTDEGCHAGCCSAALAVEAHKTGMKVGCHTGCSPTAGAAGGTPNREEGRLPQAWHWVNAREDGLLTCGMQEFLHHMCGGCQAEGRAGVDRRAQDSACGCHQSTRMVAEGHAVPAESRCSGCAAAPAVGTRLKGKANEQGSSTCR
eukprot:1160477-Pelagomonas_calceolata.AAC.14